MVQNFSLIFASLICSIFQGIDEREQQLLLKKILKPIWLETHHTESVRKYRIRGFGASARQHTFPRMVDGVASDTQERQSVYDYFLEKYNIKLKYPNLPTVGKNVRRLRERVWFDVHVELYTPANKTQFHYLPMECCTIQPWQRSIKPLTTDQRARVMFPSILLMIS